jgi:hypothetical protein
MQLAVEYKAHSRIAHQEQEDKHGLLYKRKPLVACEPFSPVPGQRPGKEKVEDRGDKLNVGAKTAPAWLC